ncbi:hypothetical protein [Sorangium sp. So ce1024]|uniref:hypothetical protein n=1 Tax=Sorangium sp. So ce1024 TaxID=3133327 RepID=UPI003F127E90
MGECGCGSSGAHYRLPAPDGATYVIQLQPTCRYCPEGPAGVAVHRWSKQHKKEVEGWPALDLHDYGHGYADAGLVVLDPEEARRRVAAYLVQAKLAEDEFAAEEHAKEIVSDCIEPLLFEQPSNKGR